MSSLMRATNLWGYDDLVRQLGADPGPLLASVHLPPANQRQDDSFLPYRSIALLLEASALRLGCPDFGRRLSAWQGLDILGPVAVIARNAGTVLEAFLAIGRYLYIHCPALELRLASGAAADTLRFEYRITELSAAQIPQSYELSLANALQILQLLAGPGQRPARVWFMHAPQGPRADYSSAFQCPVQFEQDSCGFEISAAVGRKAVDQADSQTLQLATAYLESRYVPGVTALSARVAELIRRLLPTGQCHAQVIADSLAMHPRTLQRRLAEEGKRYDLLLDDERRQLAERYLGQPGLHLSQVTGLLGYAEQSTFNRSCRRWFGMTPRQYRQHSSRAETLS